MNSRLSKTVWLSLLLVVVASGVSSAAERGSCDCGNEAGAIHARIKGGVGFFSNLGETFFVDNDPAPAFGLDLGVELGGGFGLMAGGRLILENRSSRIDGTNAIDSRFFSVAPTYSVKKGRARVTASLALGILSSSLETFPVGGSQTNVNTSRFGIAPGVDLDVQIGGGATLNLSFQYLFGTGTEPSPDLLMPMAGIGWEF